MACLPNKSAKQLVQSHNALPPGSALGLWVAATAQMRARIKSLVNLPGVRRSCLVGRSQETFAGMVGTPNFCHLEERSYCNTASTPGSLASRRSWYYQWSIYLKKKKKKKHSSFFSYILTPLCTKVYYWLEENLKGGPSAIRTRRPESTAKKKRRLLWHHGYVTDYIRCIIVPTESTQSSYLRFNTTKCLTNVSDLFLISPGVVCSTD